MRKNYRKPLAFILTLLLVFGTLGFAFASDAGNGIESCTKIESGDPGWLTVSYGGIESTAVEMTDKDFVVVKQATFAVIWTKEALDEGEEDPLINALADCDPSLAGGTRDFYFTTSETYEMGGGTYYFNISSGVYDLEGIELDGRYAIASPSDKVSHFLIGTFNEDPTYNVSCTINKDVVVLAGSPAEKDFTFTVQVSGPSIQIADKTITIPAGSTEGSALINLSGLAESDFPIDLTIAEKGGSVENGWTYDTSQKTISVALNEQKQVTYNGGTEPGSVTFTNEFSGSYEISIPVEKAFAGDPGFPAEAFEFSAMTTPAGVLVGTSSLTLTSEDGAEGVIHVSFPGGTTAEDFPMKLLVQETAGEDPSWTYDGGSYLVTVDLLQGVPTIINIEKVVPENQMTVAARIAQMETIVFTNTYTAPLTFEVPFTKNVIGEDYGTETFHFTAELIPTTTDTAVASDSASLTFSDSMATSDGAFEFELTSTQAAAWLPAQIRISETAGASADWDYDQKVFWGQVDEDGIVGEEFMVNQTTASSIAFTNEYEGLPVDLQIPIYKIGKVIEGTFRTQTFNFDVSVKHGEGWEAITGASVTLTYPGSLNEQAVLNFSASQLEQYAEDYGYPVIIRITEQNNGASYWTYDGIEYYLQLTIGAEEDLWTIQAMNEWEWEIITPAAIYLGCDCPTLDEITEMLPANGEFNLDYGVDSKFIMNVLNGGILDGAHRAWCIDRDHGVYYDSNYFTNFYNSYAAIPSHLTTGDKPNIDHPENLDLVNWLINNHDGFTPWEAQNVIWHLVDSTPGFELNVNETVLFDLAVANGEGFEPNFCNGDRVGIIAEPIMLGDQLVSGQALLLEFGVECDPIYDEETDVIFQNSFKRSGGSNGGGDSDDDEKTDIPEKVIPLEEGPVEITEVIIPEAEIPATGGLGILAFLALGGTIAAAGVSLRKK